MAMSKRAALDAARGIIAGPRSAEAPRLERIRQALRPCIGPGEFLPSVQLPEGAPALMREIARKSRTNYLPLLVKTFAQVMKVDGYISSVGGDRSPWMYWQQNRMDARQTGLTRSVLQYGTAYAKAVPGSLRGSPAPAVSLFTPREMTAVYQDPEADEWPMFALERSGQIVTLTDEDSDYLFGVESNSPSWLPVAGQVDFGMGALTFIEERPHGFGFVPVVRYRDRFLLSGEEQCGIVEPLFEVQDRIDETTFEMMVAQYFGAFRQRYVLGWVPKNEAEELRAGAGYAWYLKQQAGETQEIKIGELEQTDPKPYLESLASAKRDFAAMGQIPAQSLGLDGISNISDATLAGLEAAKNREADEITTALGESHEQLFRLCGLIDGNDAVADDYAAEVKWRDFEARSFAQTVDGLVKLAQGIGLPPEIALEDVPGMTGQKLERARAALREQRSQSDMALLANAITRQTP